MAETERQNVIAAARQRQPLPELLRKAEKARSPGFWTQEDLDLAKAEARELVEGINWE